MVSACMVSVADVRDPAQQPVDPNRWEPAIQKFEARGQSASSGKRRHRLHRRIEYRPVESPRVVSRCAGGQQRLRRIGNGRQRPLRKPRSDPVTPLEWSCCIPAKTICARGTTPATIGAGFQTFYTVIRTALPQTRNRGDRAQAHAGPVALTAQMHEANKLIRSYCKSNSGCVYVDVWPAMLGPDGKPRPEHFIADGQHMTPEGYTVWTELVKPLLK